MFAGSKTMPVRISRFWSVILTIVVVLAVVEWLIPAISREVTGLPFPLTVPRTLLFFYMVLTLIGLFLYVTFSDEALEEFWQPIRSYLRGDYGKTVRTAGFILLPLIAGWWVYDLILPKSETPLALRIQHPSSNFPKSFEDLRNPFAEPDDGEVEVFLQQVMDRQVEFIVQVRSDLDAWIDTRDEPDQHVLSAINTPAIQELLKQLDGGEVDRQTARAALVEKNLFEGRALYSMNCRPCHGDSVSGDGPMADGFKLRPINFTDSGTLETIVEGYTFWRVSNGGPGLPTEATPWDSAMPEWKLSLTEDERWKIILAEYDLAEKTPRIPESE